MAVADAEGEAVATDLRRRLQARPFEPFAYELPNGRRTEVHHPEEATLSAGAIQITRDGRWVETASLSHIVGVEPLGHQPLVAAAQAASNESPRGMPAPHGSSRERDARG
jgi:hypothetical protein